MQKQLKCNELRIRAVRARNEYVLSLEACNAQLHRLQQDSVAELLDTLHCGYQNTLQRLANLHANAEKGLMRGSLGRAEALRRCASQLDPKIDRRNVLRQPVFARNRQLLFQNAREDDLTSACLLLVATKALDANDENAAVCVDMDSVQRAILLKRRLEELRIEADEDWKLVELSERAVNETLALPLSDDDETVDLNVAVCRKYFHFSDNFFSGSIVSEFRCKLFCSISFVLCDVYYVM